MLSPHRQQAGEMVDLLHITERCLQQFRIKYRAPDILHCRGRTSGRSKIKNTHATIVREKGRHQMLPNKAAATCNECLPHGSLPKSPESSPLAMIVDLGKPIYRPCGRYMAIAGPAPLVTTGGGALPLPKYCAQPAIL